MSAVIVSQRFRDNEIVHSMKLANVKIGGSILPDLIFPECAPSLAIAFCEANTVNQGTLKRFRDIEKQFKNAIGIVIAIEDDELWTSFQLTAELTTMRLFRVTDTNEAASLAQQCRLELSNKQKFELQTVYFNKERENIAGAESVRSLLQEIFRGLGVPEEDAQIILDGFPTMQQLVRATEEELAENSPASMNSIRAIAAFFQGH